MWAPPRPRHHVQSAQADFAASRSEPPAGTSVQRPPTRPLTPTRPHALTRPRRPPPLILAIPALYALARHFDGLYGQDPFAYYDYAIGPLRAALAQPALPPPYYYPPGYPLLVTLATYLVGTRPLAGQLVSLLAGALVPLLTALLAHEALHWGTSVDRPRREAIASPVATASSPAPHPLPRKGEGRAAARGGVITPPRPHAPHTPTIPRSPPPLPTSSPSSPDL
ncbi:MAG: hypothetical protein U0841_15745 [Chloroflexia bacterium]